MKKLACCLPFNLSNLVMEEKLQTSVTCQFLHKIPCNNNLLGRKITDLSHMQKEVVDLHGMSFCSREIDQTTWYVHVQELWWWNERWVKYHWSKLMSHIISYRPRDMKSSFRICNICTRTYFGVKLSILTDEHIIILVKFYLSYYRVSLLPNKLPYVNETIIFSPWV